MTATYKEALGRDIDTPTKERFKHDDFDFEQVIEKQPKVLRNKNQTPYHKAHSKGNLTDKQLDAAEWFEKAYTLVYGGLVGGTRDTLDITPRGAPSSDGGSAHYINTKDLLAKVEARLKLETRKEHDERNRKLKPARRASKPLLVVGKDGNERYSAVREVCAYGDSIGKIEPTRKRYLLLCEGLDIVHDVVF